MFQEELQLFQRSKETIWTDDYISKRLLDAHLDESFDGASRKKELRGKIINWINNNIDKNSNIVDLGCGPGLYSYEFGKIEHRVLGIDFNKESINYANKNKSIDNLVEYKYGNYLEGNIEGKYDVALMIWCDFGALIPAEQNILLKKVGNLLTDGGLFIFDVFGRELLNNRKEMKNWHISNGGDFWSKDPYFLMEEIKYFKEESTIGNRNYIINQLTGEIKEYIMWDQYYDEKTIDKIMIENGFDIMEINKDIIKEEETLFLKTKKKKL